MTASDPSRLVQDEFHLLNRRLTYTTAAIMCVLALIFWWFDVEVKGHMATLVGAAFIAMAVFTFKIPYISYRYLLRKYRDEPDRLAALGPGWREFKRDVRKGGGR